jgi:peptide/nickel transport system permease protein
LANFLISRLLYAAVVLLGVSVAVFFLIRIGGDPSALFLPPEAPIEEIQRFRHLMGFDRPLIIQYFEFLGRAVQGDFGMSLRYEQPAMSLVLERVPATLELGGMAFIMSLAVAIPLAILAAANRGSAIDRVSLLISLIGQSFPAFWLAIMLILLFSETFHVLPPSGTRRLATSDHAGNRARDLFHGDHHAPAALVDDRSAAIGLCAHRPRQGRP